MLNLGRTNIVEKRYRTLVVDPVWNFDRGSARLPNPAAALEAIRNLPIRNFSADSAHLYLRIPDSLVAEGIELMRHWGFDFKTILLWIKHQPCPGDYFLNAHELIFFGVKGSLPTLKRAQGFPANPALCPPRAELSPTGRPDAG